MNLSWLSLHYPIEETFEEKRNTILSLSVSAGLVLILLQPFGFSLAEQSIHFLALVLIALLSMGMNHFFLPQLFPAIFDDSRWSIAKALMFLTYNFLIIGLWHHLYQVIIVEQNIFLIASGEQLFSGLFKALAIGLAASSFYVLIRYNILTRRHLQIAQELNDTTTFQKGPILAAGTWKILLLLENKEIAVDRNDLLCITSEGNYISLRIRGEKKSSLFRATMKHVETSLAEFPEFFRCHRSHIINLNVIASLKGNSQGLFVELDDLVDKIPVSRPKIKWLRNAVAQNTQKGKQFVTK